MNLIRYKRYTRKEIHDIFSPDTAFTVGAGSWGLSGIVRIRPVKKDYIFFVTLGQKQAWHTFKEDIDENGILSWQSQPQQNFGSSQINDFIHHDFTKNNIYLFLRENKKSDYIYLGLLAYVSHDSTKENPVYFRWQILDWKVKNTEIDLDIDQNFSPALAKEFCLSKSKTKDFTKRKFSKAKNVFLKKDSYNIVDFDKIHNQNTKLGTLGEDIVVEYEKRELMKAGRKDLAKKVVATRNTIGNTAKFDIYSYEADGTEKYIEVKTTTGECDDFFFISGNELQYSCDLQDKYYLYRLYHLDLKNKTVEFKVLNGAIRADDLKSIHYVGRISDLINKKS